MVSHAVNFRFLKSQARKKITLLRKANKAPHVAKALNALRRSLALFDNCTQMGLQITFASKDALVKARRAARAKR